MKKEEKETIPWWVLDNPGSVAKALWEQKIIKELCKRLPEEQAELIVVGYMNGNRDCQECFDRVSRHTRFRECRTLPKQERRPDSWRRPAGLRG